MLTRRLMIALAATAAFGHSAAHAEDWRAKYPELGSPSFRPKRIRCIGPLRAIHRLSV